MWQRFRLWWWERICGLPRESALDLMDGIDHGDRVTTCFRLIIVRRRCPRRAGAGDIERMDREFLAGGDKQTEIARRVLEDLGRRAKEDRRREVAHRRAADYFARRN